MQTIFVQVKCELGRAYEVADEAVEIEPGDAVAVRGERRVVRPLHRHLLAEAAGTKPAVAMSCSCNLLLQAHVGDLAD